MKRIGVGIAVFLFACAAVFGQRTDTAVTVRAVPPSGPLTPGQPAVLTIELDIHEPYHINSDKPLEDYLIPTRVTFNPNPGVNLGRITFPPAPVKKLEVSEMPMSVWEEGVVRITAEITPAPDLKEREITLDGRVRYQACNDRTCLPPVNAPFSFVLALALNAGSTAAMQEVSSTQAATAQTAPPTGPGFIPLDQAPQQAGGESPVQPSPSSQLDFADQGLLLTFGFCFIMGLGLNLTPCVYPMIPITISYFGGQAQGKRGSLFLHSSLYVIGMAVTYSILGTVAALTGSLFGSALQYPAVLIGIAAIFTILALSMFDVYELQMPSFLNRLAGSSHKGFFGTFFMGLTVGIVAAPCIGPFVLSLLAYVGSIGSPILGFSLFFVLALGLGLPFLFLGIFSGSIKLLPRSGGWMIWVRKIFGFILIAMAVFFLKTLFPSQLLYELTLALTLLLGGIYMAWIEPTQTSGKFFPYLRNAVGLVFFGIALYTAALGIQEHVDETVLVKVQDLSGGQGGPVAGAVQWLSYADGRIEQAAQEGRPVLIDFYADWCAACKELDKKTFTDPEVIAASREFTMIKVDLTSSEDPQSVALTEKYQILGLPTLVFLNPDGRELADLRVTGFETAEVFLNKMNKALQWNRTASR